MHGTLLNERHQFNQEFCDKEGNLKEKKKNFAVNLDDLKEDYKALYEEFRYCNSNLV